jgi:hypothetical protein
LFSLSDKYQRLFTSINSTGESNSTPGKDKNNKQFQLSIFHLNLACTNEVYKSVLERNQNLERENERIQRLNTSLQSRIHEITLRVNIRSIDYLSFNFLSLKFSVQILIIN